MKRNTIFLLSITAILIWSSCEFESYSDYEPDPYDGEFTWTREVKNADWGNRYDHAAAVFNNKMWVSGGYNPGKISGDTYYEDIWSSEDGKNWTLENEDAPWHGRRGHQLLSFDDGNGEALFLIGGFEVMEESGFRQYTNDVWKSNDGKNWTQIRPRTYVPKDSLFDWLPRMKHTCLVKEVDGEPFIYLMAGRTMLDSMDGRFANVYHNDVWRSKNAIDWERIENSDYGIRGDQAAVIDPNTGRMYLQGGAHGFVFSAEDYGTHPIKNWEYLWYSDDGKEWHATNDTAAMDQTLLWRASHKMLFYQDAIWAFPGKSLSNEHYLFSNSEYYPIWRYEPDGGWSVDSYGAAFDPRHAYEALVFNNRVWILGGFTSNIGQANDVWSGIIN